MKKILEKYNGIDYYLYILKNDDIEVSVCNYGATLCNFKYKGTDIVQGFENVSSYVEDVKYMNATIGRVCNRIEKGRFFLNGQEYRVPINNGPNSLHGGIDGFDSKYFDIKENGNKLVCTYESKDMEEGYPGNLSLKVIYELLDDGLCFAYEATSDKDTLVNICNHAFFNIDGPKSETVLNDYLMINADYIGKIDKDGCTRDEIMNVKDTPFDFSVRKRIGQNIDDRHEQILNANGYDHHYLIKGEGLRWFCSYDNEKIRLDVYSDLPGMHVYSSNYLNGTSKGKEGGRYPKRSSICFETQYYPNAINCINHKKPILKAGDTIKHKTIFKVKEI